MIDNKKVVLITGCGGLLGTKLCEYYIKNDYYVIGFDKEHTYQIHEFHKFDALDLDESSLSSLVNFSKVDVLINAIGMTHLDWIEDYPVSELEKMYKVNVYAPYAFIRAFISANLETENIRTICNIVSMGSNMAMRTSVGYCSTKAAFAMMTKQISREVSGKHKQFRVFGINPCGFGDGTDKIGGIIEDVLPQMLRTRPQQFPDIETAKKYNLQSPTGELLHVDDLVKFVAFMIEFNNVHMNGSLINFWDAGA